MTPTRAYWKGRPVMYRVFDNTGRLIYVGQSIDVCNRLAEHRSQSWWFRLLADRVRVQLHATQADAKAAEKVAIQEEQPVFNAMGYGDWRDYPHWTDSDHALYAAWHRAVRAESDASSGPRRGMAERLASGARRRLAVTSAT